MYDWNFQEVLLVIEEMFAFFVESNVIDERSHNDHYRQCAFKDIMPMEAFFSFLASSKR